MISTVTVSTISTITTITTTSIVTTIGMAAALSIAATITLMGFLATKTLVSVSPDNSSQRIGRFLNVAVPPLLVVFAVMVAMTIAETL